jgi:alkylation response protein AidB-like acyl-CoA dehydrogenase
VTAPAATDLARQVSEDVLYPSALAVDVADLVPAGHLEALADAGLYGIAGPADYGGGDADLVTFSRVVEILAGGCLTTTFVWIQHHGVVRALAACPNSRLREEWLRALIAGRRRAGIALGGARPGPPLLQARRAAGGYVLDGTAPWVTGWGLIDVLYTLARTKEGDLVAALLPGRAGDQLTASRMRLVAVNASGTVELTFTGYFVPEESVCSVFPQDEWLAQEPRRLRPNGSLALGLAGRCCRLAGPSPLDAELDRLRDRLDRAALDRAALDGAVLDTAAAAGPGADDMPAARAAAAELAYRAAAAAITAAGSRSILAGQHPQRLAREAQFLLVFGSRPAIKENLLSLLGRLP